jgi:hypothetical protein
MIMRIIMIMAMLTITPMLSRMDMAAMNRMNRPS